MRSRRRAGGVLVALRSRSNEWLREPEILQLISLHLKRMLAWLMS